MKLRTYDGPVHICFEFDVEGGTLEVVDQATDGTTNTIQCDEGNIRVLSDTLRRLHESPITTPTHVTADIISRAIEHELSCCTLLDSTIGDDTVQRALQECVVAAASAQRARLDEFKHTDWCMVLIAANNLPATMVADAFVAQGSGIVYPPSQVTVLNIHPQQYSVKEPVTRNGISVTIVEGAVLGNTSAEIVRKVLKDNRHGGVVGVRQ